MGFISRQIENIYKKALLCRRDDDGTLFYFSHTDFSGLQRTPYSFKTKKGHTLNGYFYHYSDYSSYSKDRLIVFDHGMGTGHRAYMKEIEILARHGFLVYSYDHTGCTESEGEHIMGLTGSLADLDCCITSLKEDKGYNGSAISVVGHSWGGYSTLNILALHPDIRSIVAMSGFISLDEMHRQLIPVAPLRRQLYRLEQQINPDYVDRSAIQALSSTDAPALIIHSLDDATVSAKRHFYKLRAALADKPNVTFITLTDRDHNPNYTAAAVRYKDEFFKALKARAKKEKQRDPAAHKVFLSSYDWHKITEQDADLWSKIFEHLDK